MPIVNPIFEPEQNTAETIVSVDALFMAPLNHAMELSGAQNDFRTSRKSPVKARPGDFVTTSGPLLRALHAFRTAIWQIPGNISPFKIVNYW
jgi:hypothetical protein